MAPLIDRVLRWGKADAVFVPLLNLIYESGEEPVHWPDLQARVFRSSS